MRLRPQTWLSLALVAVAAGLVLLWRRDRQAAAADPQALEREQTPVIVNDAGAKILAEDNTDEIVRQLIEYSKQTNSGIAFESGDTALFFRTNRYLYPDEVPPIWGERTTSGSTAPNVQ